MLLSQKKRFIFIHIYKNAGTSIKNALLPFCANKFQIFLWRLLKQRSTILRSPLQPYPTHITASDILDKIGIDEFKSFYSFAFVRNPWDWQVSLYKYMLKSADHHQHQLVKELGNFDEYIRWRCSREIRFQKDFICSKDGKVLIDFVGRFERIDEDFEKICSQIGVSASLPKLNVSNATPYREYYTDETRDIVMQTYQPDIAFLGYDF